MKYHKQRFKHDPANGSYGDCHRTAIACLLDLEPEDVPNFGEHYGNTDAFNGAVKSFLADHGYTTFTVPLSPDLPLSQVLEWMNHWNPSTTFMLAGIAERGFNHTVICSSGRIIHDPHPSGSGLIGPCEEGGVKSAWWVDVLVPLSVHGLAA